MLSNWGRLAVKDLPSDKATIPSWSLMPYKSRLTFSKRRHRGQLLTAGIYKSQVRDWLRHWWSLIVLHQTQTLLIQIYLEYFTQRWSVRSTLNTALQAAYKQHACHIRAARQEKYLWWHFPATQRQCHRKILIIGLPSVRHDNVTETAKHSDPSLEQWHDKERMSVPSF